MKFPRTAAALVLLTASCGETGAQQGGTASPQKTAAAPAPESNFVIGQRIQAKLADRFDNVLDYSEGLVVVYKDGTYTLADTTGKLLLPFGFEQVTGFENGYATVIKDGKARLIDRSGKAVFSPRQDLAFIGTVQDGWAYARDNRERYGFINTKGETVIPFDYDNISVEGFADGVAVVVKNGKYGLINKQNGWVAPAVYDNIISFSTGMNVTPVQQGGKWGLLRKNGSLSRPVNMGYKDVYPFGSGGMTVVENNLGKKGYIDSTGKEVFKPTLDLADGFNQWGFAAVHQGGEAYLIDRTGAPFLKKGYWSIVQAAPDQFIVSIREGERYGMVSKAGAQLWPMEYSSIVPMDENLFLVKRADGGPMYYADLQGKKIMEYRSSGE